MSERAWTQAQRQAIDAAGGTLLISAAAGSGKTAVLVEKTIELITKHGVEADRLLILTFSKAAAEELRSRIARRIDALCRENRDDPRLARQRLLIQKANINTVHAFCLDIVREYFNILAIPPDFTLNDETVLGELRSAAADETMEQMFSNAAFAEFAAMFGRAKSDAEVRGMLLATYNKLRNMPNVGEAINKLESDYTVCNKLEQTAWAQLLFDEALRACEAALKLAQGGESLCAGHILLEKYANAFTEAKADIAVMRATVEKRDWALCEQLAQGLKLAGASQRGADETATQAAKNLRANIAKCYKDLNEAIFSCTEQQFMQDISVLTPQISAFAQALRIFDARFFELKKQNRVFEFSDMQHLALKLFISEGKKRTNVATQVAKRFDYVMVDEYQDTSGLDDLIYSCVANAQGTNLLYVGDVKQSIYGFRAARPENFLEKMNAFAVFNNKNYPAMLYLGHNFRSSAGVVNGVNFVFEKIMSKQLGAVEYSEGERLIKAAPGTTAGTAQLHIVRTGANEADVFAEARYVAQFIKKSVEEKTLIDVAQGDATVTRAAKYEDFCILLRAKKHAVHFAAALAAQGVPAISIKDDVLFLRPEILPVISLLQVIDNRAQDIPLAAAMLSPLCGFKPDDLLRLKIQSKNVPLYTALALSDDEKMVEFKKRLEYLSALALTMQPAELIEHIVFKSGYAAACGAQPGGAVLKANLHSLVDFALAHAKRSSGGLHALLAAFEAAVESKSEQRAAFTKKQGAVVIMTVHASKGLEFPICVLAQTGKRFNKRDLSDNLLYSPALGIGTKMRENGGDLYRTAAFMANRFEAERELLSEEMRILYVALTRARQQLIITGADDNVQRLLQNVSYAVTQDGSVDSYLLSGYDSYLKWLCAAALANPANDELLALAGRAKLDETLENGGFVAKIVQADEQTPQQSENGETYAQAAHVQTAPGQVADTQTTPAAATSAQAAPVQTAPVEVAADPDATARFAAVLSAKYPLEQLANVPLKLSVSALAKKQSDATFERPRFMQQSGLTAAERGTALHAFMQLANYEAAEHDVQAELARLENGQFISPEQAQVIDVKKVQTFFASELYARMKRAPKVLREHAFLHAITAGQLDNTLPQQLKSERVYLQGIADLVFFEQDGYVIADYKTDAVKTAQQLRERYATQLTLYADALEQQFGTRAKQCVIYSFALDAQVEIV